MKIGLILIATNKYIDFLEPLLNSIDNFLPNHTKVIYLFTDSNKDIKFKNLEIITIKVEHKPFPYSTLMRYYWINSIKNKINTDYLFYSDVDMKFIDVKDEVLHDLVGIRHPGFKENNWNWYKNYKSTAYIPLGNRKVYCCGGFQGGKTISYLKACKILSENIEIDNKNNILADWNDESHWNWYLSNNEFIELSSSYCYPENVENTFKIDNTYVHLKDIKPKIIALNKNHNKYQKNDYNYLTFKKLGTNGRVGNQLFQYASSIGIAKDNNKILELDYWNYQIYFKGKFPIKQDKDDFKEFKDIKELNFHYDKYNFEENENINLEGYFQSEKYWINCIKEIKDTFTFNEPFILYCKTKISKNCFKKETIAIHIRRGDYINNSNYNNLTITYYILSLYKYFPNWRDYNLVIFSDDIPYCKVHFGCLENVYFSENNSDIEDICLMSQCSHFIIANSSFSWWAAYIGEKEGTKIICPSNYFKGELLKKCDIMDFYPKNWIKEDFKDKKINLKNVTFNVPVTYDHSDRKENLGLSIFFLQHYFNTNIIIMEKNTDNFKYTESFATYIKYDDKTNNFHRTKMLNEMAKISNTDYIVNWDCDIILPPMQILNSLYILKYNVDMVYPYDGRFARLPREWLNPLRNSKDIGIIRNTIFKGMEKECIGIDTFYASKISTGGCVFWNKKSFLSIKGENENMISYAPEDTERFFRAKKLGLKIERVKGCLYHIQHYTGSNSREYGHSFFKNNLDEFNKINKMSKEELINYIKTWNWLKT